MSDMSLQAITRVIREAAYPLIGAAHDYDPLLDLIGDAHFVLIGEASHGTHEFYRERATITKRLIMEKGFTVVAIEADWPDAYRVNRYVRDIDDDTSGNEALAGFKRFPTWMWRNTDVLEFIEWLRLYNRGLAPDRPKVGFYGLDLYSLYTSIEAVIAYLEQVDPEAAQRARTRYSCFEHFGEDTASYGYAASLGLTASCEDDVVNQLKELQQKMTNYARRDGRGAEDEFFYAQQNARLARDAEEYYRSMFRASDESWNVRDRHMADTLDALVAHFDRYGGSTKAVVWEHNSHLGDARATSTSAEGELNVGQLVRERYDQDARLIGFTTYSGTVTAASDWDQPAERKRVRPALAGSYEFLFHQTGIENFLLDLRADEKVMAGLHKPRLERAIGVIYLPQTERRSHYFHARLPEQFDAIIHLDQTQALEPLEPTAQWQSGEVEETFPSGL
ncbi:MAG: erythromycin esterase family protein [Ktedonobacteraceae bacterium]